MSAPDALSPDLTAVGGSRWLRRLEALFYWVFVPLASAWAFGAVWFDFPGGPRSAWLWLAAGGGLVYMLRKNRHRNKVWPGMFLLVWLPWLTIRPSNTRDWSPEYARAARAEVNGDVVTVHDIRNFEYHIDGLTGDIIQLPFWESRTYRLSELRGIDMFINYWGSPWMAHPILSFDFGPSGHIAFSIETRREATEKYSAVAGLYKHYELTYIAGTEDDLIRLRTNLRKGEDVFLYRLKTPPDIARERFLEYVARLNQLHAKPQFYDVLMANCTTSIRAQVSATEHQPWDWRFLLNGKIDEMLHERGAFQGPEDLPFAEWKEKAKINAAAKEHESTGTFSERIRRGRPGF